MGFVYWYLGVTELYCPGKMRCQITRQMCSGLKQALLVRYSACINFKTRGFFLTTSQRRNKSPLGRGLCFFVG